MTNKYDYLNQDSKPNTVSKKLSMIIHHEEIQRLSIIIQEIMEEKSSQDNTIKG